MGKLLYSSSTWWATVPQHEESRVETIVNNSAVDTHIFSEMQCTLLVHLYKYLKISYSGIGFRLNQIVTNYRFDPKFSIFTQHYSFTNLTTVLVLNSGRLLYNLLSNYHCETCQFFW